MTLKPDDSAIIKGVQAISIKIFGEPASKANSRRLVRFNNISRLIKSNKALTYSESFKQQCSTLTLPPPILEGDVRVNMTIYYASRRPDLDESLILDLLQGVAYQNDRQVKGKHIYWRLDKDAPRAEIFVERMLNVDEKKPARRRAVKGEATV